MRGERRAGAGVPAEQFAERIGDAFGEDRGHADRHGDTDAVAQQADVLDGHPPRLPGERHRERALGLAQPLQPAADVVGGAPLGDLGLGQRAEQSQQVGDALGVAGRAILAEVLQLRCGAGDHLRVEQLAQFDAAEQLGQQHAVQRQRGGAALGQRAVALVHERPDVAEQQRRRERRRCLGLDLDQPQPALRDPVHQLGQRRHVVDVLQAFADRLEHDREVRVLAGHIEQLRGALPLMPQRRPLARVAARQQQGAGRAFAEPGGEQRRTAHLGGDDRLDLVGVEDEQLGARRGVLGVGQPDDDAVVGGGRLLVDAVALAQPSRHRQRQRTVHPKPVRGVQDHPPVAELVAEPLDHEGGVGRHGAGGLALVVQQLPQVVGRVVVESHCGATLGEVVPAQARRARR